MKKTILTLAASLLLAASTLAAPPSKSMVGQKAPSLSGQKARGAGLMKLRSLMKEFGFKKDANGKMIEKNGKYIPLVSTNVVVLNFFSTTCVPCMREIPTYNRIADHFKGKPVKLIYVNIDTEVSDQELIRFIAKKKINLPMMLPNQRDAIKKYQVYSLPRIIVIGKDGKIAHEVKGFHSELESNLTGWINELIAG